MKNPIGIGLKSILRITPVEGSGFSTERTIMVRPVAIIRGDGASWEFCFPAMAPVHLLTADTEEVISDSIWVTLGSLTYSEGDGKYRLNYHDPDDPLNADDFVVEVT